MRGGSVQPGEAVTLGIRPEHFVEPRGATTTFAATAQVVEQLGGVSYVYAVGAEGSLVTVQEKGHSAVPPGSPFTIGVDPAACLLFDGSGKRL